MFFSKQKVLESDLSKEEILLRIKSITLNKSAENIFNKTLKPFEGEINKNSFKIFPTFGYSLSTLARPYIAGEVKEIEKTTKIFINSGLPLYIKYILYAILFINLGIILLSIEVSNSFHLYSIVTLFIFWFFINSKSEKSFLILKELIN